MKTTEETNRLIAEFMGYEVYKDGYCDNAPNKEVESLPMLEYMFQDWNELMPVIEKLHEGGGELSQRESHKLQKVYHKLLDIDLGGTYLAVVELIEWKTAR